MPLQDTAGVDLGTSGGYGMIMSTAVGCRIDTTHTAYITLYYRSMNKAQ